MDPYIRDYNYTPIETYIVNNRSEYRALSVDNNINFKIFHNNIRSISKNFDEMNIFLEGLNEQFDVLVFTECWKVLNTNLFNKYGYDLLYNNGDLNQNDGVIVYIKSEHEYKYNITKLGDINALNIKISFYNKIFNIIAIYRPPSTCPYLFNHNLNTFLSNNNFNLSENTIIIGDINININSNLDPSQEYLNILWENGFIPFVNKPTRECGYQTSCIDHIFLKSKEPPAKFTPIIYKINITDHFPIILNFSTNHMQSDKKNYESYSKKYIDYPKLKFTLKNENWLDLYSTNKVNDATSMFIVKLKKYIDISTNTVKVKKSKIKKKPVGNKRLNQINRNKK